jgi:DNA repair protein RecO (recombination protein O)
MATYRTIGFIIKRNDFGEADRILTLFTQYKGKISAIAKGVRKMESRKGGNVELFNLTRFQLAEGKSMDLVVEAEVEESYRHLREDLHLISLVYQLIELVDQFIQEDQQSSVAYLLFKQALSSLNNSPTEEEARKIAAFFQINFLTTVGFKPEMTQCVKCGHKLVEDGNIFSPHLGGVVDKNCRLQVVSGVEISIEAIKTLRFFQTEDWAKAQKLKIEPLVLHEIENLLQSYIEFVLEKDLKAVAFSKKTRTL